jgi:hypothetical protein
MKRGDGALGQDSSVRLAPLLLNGVWLLGCCLKPAAIRVAIAIHKSGSQWLPLLRNSLDSSVILWMSPGFSVVLWMSLEFWA